MPPLQSGDICTNGSERLTLRNRKYLRNVQPLNHQPSHPNYIPRIPPSPTPLSSSPAHTNNNAPDIDIIEERPSDTQHIPILPHASSEANTIPQSNILEITDHSLQSVDTTLQSYAAEAQQPIPTLSIDTSPTVTNRPPGNKRPPAWHKEYEIGTIVDSNTHATLYDTY